MSTTKTCSIDGCSRAHCARGWCSTHYARWRKYGSVEDRPLPPRTLESIEKQRATLKRMHAEGTWKSPSRPGPNPKKGHHGQRNYMYRPVGSKRVDRGGYVGIKIADPSTWAAEHRWVMEQHLGRKLRKDEHVHHLNRDKQDNRIENLEVMDAVEHCKLSSSHRRRWPSCVTCGYRHPPHEDGHA